MTHFNVSCLRKGFSFNIFNLTSILAGRLLWNFISLEKVSDATGIT